LKIKFNNEKKLKYVTTLILAIISIWYGNLNDITAKLSMMTFAYQSPSYLVYGSPGCGKLTSLLHIKQTLLVLQPIFPEVYFYESQNTRPRED